MFRFQKVEQQRPVSLDERRLQKFWDKSNGNSFIWIPLQRPQSLNLETSSFLTSKYTRLLTFFARICLKFSHNYVKFLFD